VEFALNEPELSPRELAVRFTETESYFVSEASVYRLLKAHDLITSPAFIVVKAADEFKDKTTAPNQLWQTDFTYLKVIGWGWFYLSTILDDYFRYIIAWKLCTTMKVQDVTDTLEMALAASGGDAARVRHKPRLLSDSGSCYIAGDLADWLSDRDMDHVHGTEPSSDPGQDRPPTSISDAARPSCCNEDGSSERPSNTGACDIAKPQPKMPTRWARASAQSDRHLSQIP
jgi:putative transposase